MIEIAGFAPTGKIPVMESLNEWLDERLRSKGKRAADLARRLKLAPDKVSKMRNGTRRIAAEELIVIEDFLGERAPTDAAHDQWEPEPAPGSSPEMVRVVGYVGAGSEAYFFPPGDLDEVPAPVGATAETVAVEVRGESLGSMFDRWLVFYDDVRRPVTADLIGRLCVVGLEDGRVLVKRVRRGRQSGLFHLYSQQGDPIYDVAIEWAAKVKNMAPQ